MSPLLSAGITALTPSDASRRRVCRYCGKDLIWPQNLEWRMCDACYYEGLAEHEANR